jgi:hypothetical protein
MFGTLEIGHLEHLGVQRVQCWPFPELKYYGSNREDAVFVRPPGVENFELSPDNHLGTMTIRISWDIPTYLTYPDLSATYG